MSWRNSKAGRTTWKVPPSSQTSADVGWSTPLPVGHGDMRTAAAGGSAAGIIRSDTVPVDDASPGPCASTDTSRGPFATTTTIALTAILLARPAMAVRSRRRTTAAAAPTPYRPSHRSTPILATDPCHRRRRAPRPALSAPLPPDRPPPRPKAATDPIDGGGEGWWGGANGGAAPSPASSSSPPQTIPSSLPRWQPSPMRRRVGPARTLSR